jgi:hypothetical protein
MGDASGSQPKPPSYRVELRNRQVAADWKQLKQVRPEACKRLVKHIQDNPRARIGSRYVPLKGDQKFTEYQDQMLPQWQYEIDNRARVKVAIGQDFVVIISVSSGHPKENE